ncbi:hypothetical protein HMPREF1092_03272 [Clostridium thermobutyricum]|uniref:Uncharacterized protein n=1 Tax=Clostridium thermobutyricum TaxID=29372 RepID=N9W784_9CLOT|nr:hypothetical protein [Clostridium thermobutyricum]ENY98714.1 hypothetical protein HMPREF1092_03272 [Clostridium thermobutyricum]
MDKEKIEAINRYIAIVDSLLIRLDDVIGSVDDEAYIEQCLEDDMNYINRRVRIIRNQKEELLNAFKEEK